MHTKEDYFMKKKFNPGYLGLLAIPLAGLGIVGSVAFASTTPPTSTQTLQQAPATVDAPEANDTPDTIGDTEVGEKADGQDTNEGPDANDLNDAPDAPGT